MSYLVLIRHGESIWNEKGLWTGLTNVPLDQKGRFEARKAAVLVKDIPFDIAFTSNLRRTQETLEQIKLELHYESMPSKHSAALNERDYGDLTGKNKWDIEKQYGEEQFLKWRRGWIEGPPQGESLQDVYKRTIPFFTEHIIPYLKNGENVLIVAHGNSLRSIMKYVENISDADIEHTELGTGQVVIYSLDSDAKLISKELRGVDIHNQHKDHH